MTENCEWCGKFVPDDLLYNMLCRRCEAKMEAEIPEADNGIGNGQYCDADDDYCRHYIKKWPMSETLYNALYGAMSKK